MKRRIHISHPYLLDPQHPITVDVIGCGGTGSQLLTGLARMDYALRGLNHPGLYVRVFDPDIVTEFNIGRQLFSPADIGQNKAVLSVTRVNRYFGLAWQAVSDSYCTKNITSNILITCVDNIQTRLDIAERYRYLSTPLHTDYKTHMYWMDLGNTQKAGQVVLGTAYPMDPPELEKYRTVEKLPFITDLHDLSRMKDEDSGPSCSLLEALEKQDLFINSALVQPACSLLYRLIREGGIFYHGFYFDLENLRMNPIPV